jgi:hypothetical protein
VNKRYYVPGTRGVPVVVLDGGETSSGEVCSHSCLCFICLSSLFRLTCNLCPVNSMVQLSIMKLTHFGLDRTDCNSLIPALSILSAKLLVVLILEHRYYGTSLQLPLRFLSFDTLSQVCPSPFRNFTTDSLRPLLFIFLQ